MAAYAALVSLMHTLEQVHLYGRHLIFLNKKQIESLSEKVRFLQDFFDDYSHSPGGIGKAEYYESQIAEAAYEAEDIIESHIVDEILARSKGRRSTSDILWDYAAKDIIESGVVDKILARSSGHRQRSYVLWCGIQKVIKDMDSIKKVFMKFRRKRLFKKQQPVYSMASSSSRPPTTGKNGSMIGFDDYLIRVMEWIIGDQSSRQIIPIVGMGGIGKTTLARSVYENPTTVRHFDIRAWVTVSQEYSVREILLEVLSCLGEHVSSTREEDELGEKLYKILIGRRYLVIMDDMWSIEAWDRVRFFFPDNNNRSRIIVTTRLSNTAIHFGSCRLEMNFLDEDKSWNLFCENAFSQEGCPPELEKIGKKIAKKCGGLPLSIVVIGRLLAKSNTTKQEYWVNVAKDVNSILNSGDDEHCLKILFLSYSHLPAHLKPCFLYMGIFPEDDNIHVSRLVKLWVAEGFLKPIKGKSLEEVAEDCLKDLIDRNLVLVRSWGSSGKVKTFGIHDLLRDLCLRIARRERFLCVLGYHRDFPQGISRERRILISQMMENHPKPLQDSESPLLARSLIHDSWIFDSIGNWSPVPSRLLRVLSANKSYDLSSVDQLFNLRYFSYRFIYGPKVVLPWSISLLWNVQTLTIRGHMGEIYVPPEFWRMSQFRHVEFDKIRLPDPPPDDFVLENLQTLLKVVNFRCSEEVLKRIPNIKKLQIIYDDDDFAGSYYYCLNNLVLLQKLESLGIYSQREPSRSDFLQSLTFPCSLKKVTLKGCRVPWEDLTIVGSLPNLEVLKLEEYSVIGHEWNPVEGQFLRLKFLKICRCDLSYWNADTIHFPVLENLILSWLFSLSEIPSGIGDIPTLHSIHLDMCSESAAISANEIVEEQAGFGNEGLRVRVRFLGEKRLESFRKNCKMQ